MNVNIDTGANKIMLDAMILEDRAIAADIPGDYGEAQQKIINEFSRLAKGYQGGTDKELLAKHVNMQADAFNKTGDSFYIAGFRRALELVGLDPSDIMYKLAKE